MRRGVSGTDWAGCRPTVSRNRLNVAISRARCLAYLVCSPRLLEVNALCGYVELAEHF
jgi:superfamily I DNA and/or RNA helicase